MDENTLGLIYFLAILGFILGMTAIAAWFVFRLMSLRKITETTTQHPSPGTRHLQPQRAQVESASEYFQAE